MANLVNKRDITKSNVWQMFSMLDWCYHRGVEDAYACGDLALAKEYLETEREYNDWAMMGQDYEVCWQEYLLMLINKAARTNWKGYLRNYFDSIDRFGSSYLSCFLPLTLVWYKRGVADYTSHPDACDIIKFRTQTRVYWNPWGISRIKTEQYVEECQYATYKLERRDREIWLENTEAIARKKGAINPKFYVTFRRVIKLTANHKKHWF